MPKKAPSFSINLLPSREFSFGEKFINWSLTFGRYIIIGTEIIVLLAFLSRFKLDRDLIDLNDKVKENQKVLASLSPIEDNVNRMQKRLIEIKNADSAQGTGIIALADIASLTPENITYNNIRALGDKITILGSTKETDAISQFVANLSSSSLFKKGSVNLESVERGKQEKDNINFTISGIVERGKD